MIGIGSDAKIAVPVEWAWRGKMPDDRGYRLLACSAGDINARNFEEILDRFAPGTLQKLPQVTVSYVRADGPRYLSMAFHEEAGGFDRLGRDVTFTRFFCAPYRELSAGMVSYLAMYQALERVRLSDTDAQPLRAELSRPAASIPGDAARALPVAQLLLTGNPVCIVGAESTSTAERLAYIDTVMALLPYGMRAEMTAATWTSSTYRLHRFRLFFSDAPRRTEDLEVDDHVVRWPPDATNITHAQKTRVPVNYGDEYRQWLQPLLELSITADLAQETTARAFKETDIDAMLDSIQAKQQKRFFIRGPKRREIAKNDDPPVRVIRTHDPKQAKDVTQDKIEMLIGAIAAHLNNPAADASGAQPYLEELRYELEHVSPPSDESRARYRARVTGYRLLRSDVPLPRDKKVIYYKVILRASIGQSVGYSDYCWIESVLHDRVPERPLLQAIDEIIGADLHPDLRASFFVRYHLRKQKNPADFTSKELIRIAADPQLRHDHAVVLWSAMIASVKEARENELLLVILPLLRDRGFLAAELQAQTPANLGYQVRALTDLLVTVYKGFLGPNVFPEILAGSRRYYPTLALLLAVCKLTTYDDVESLFNSFMCSLAGSDEMPEETRQELARLGWSALGNVPEETTVVPVPVQAQPTRVDAFATTGEARIYFNAMEQANPPKGKRRHGQRKPRPRLPWLAQGEFPISDKKSQESDDR